ncbi:MAG TPA: DUF998 domain-containing protein [Gemmatimonadales bacterium]|nr:DUF998 domain-containing protein [Gemmatimonadales bacterium]
MNSRLLLHCGWASALYYAAITALVPLQWAEYRSRTQTISEISAIGAPTRTLWLVLAAVYTVLTLLFAWGLLRAAAQRPSLRFAGLFLLIFGLLGLVWPLAPMHLRETIATGGGTLTDKVHIGLGLVSVLLMLAAVALTASAFGGMFRVFSWGSVLLIVLFGALTGKEAPGISSNSPTPWIGLWERASLGIFLLWVAVLSGQVLRGTEGSSR